MLHLPALIWFDPHVEQIDSILIKAKVFFVITRKPKLFVSVSSSCGFKNELSPIKLYGFI